MKQILNIGLLLLISSATWAANSEIGTETGNSLQDDFRVTSPSEFPALNRALGYIRFMVSTAIEDSQSKEIIDQELEKVRWQVSQNYLATKNGQLVEKATNQPLKGEAMIKAHVFHASDLNRIILTQSTLGMTDQQFGKTVLHEIGHTLLMRSVGNRRATPDEEAFVEQWAAHVIDAGETLSQMDKEQQRRFRDIAVAEDNTNPPSYLSMSPVDALERVRRLSADEESSRDLRGGVLFTIGAIFLGGGITYHVLTETYYPWSEDRAVMHTIGGILDVIGFTIAGSGVYQLLTDSVITSEYRSIRLQTGNPAEIQRRSEFLLEDYASQQRRSRFIWGPVLIGVGGLVALPALFVGEGTSSSRVSSTVFGSLLAGLGIIQMVLPSQAETSWHLYKRDKQNAIDGARSAVDWQVFPVLNESRSGELAYGVSLQVQF